MFKIKHNRVQLGTGINHSDGFGRFNDPSFVATVVGGFLALTVQNATTQSWYSAAPTLSLSGNPSAGVTATGTAGVSGAGAVTSVAITNAGHYYTAAPAITIGAVSGAANAAATANIGGGAVTSVTITNAGTAYTAAPSITFAAPPASVNTAPVALMGNGYIAAVTPGGTLTAYTSTPVVTFTTAGSTISAAAHAVVDPNSGTLREIVVDNPGYGYTAAPTVTLTGGGGAATATALAVMQITGFTIATFGYTSAPTVTAATHPGFEVIGLSGPGYLYDVDGRILGLRDTTENLNVIFPKPQEDNKGALTSPMSNRIIVVGRVGVVTDNLPFVLGWKS